MIRALLLKNQKPKKPKPIIFWNRIQSPWPVISYGIWLQFTFLSYLCLSPFFCLPLSPVTSTSLLFFVWAQIIPLAWNAFGAPLPLPLWVPPSFNTQARHLSLPFHWDGGTTEVWTDGLDHTLSCTKVSSTVLVSLKFSESRRPFR